jgi:hypothetical protein
MMRQTSARVGSSGTGSPRRLADSSAKSQGRPRQPAADDDSVASGPGHHRRGVGRLEDVAVAQDRDTGAVHVLHQPGDLLPVGGARVPLRGGASVAGDGGRALVGGDASGVQVGVVVVVDADAELHRHRDVGPCPASETAVTAARTMEA